MRRISAVIALALVALLGAVGAGRMTGSAMQEGTPDALAGHPLIGTWIVDPEIEDPTNPPSFDSFMADGTLVNIGSDGASVGSWVATGPRTATFTFAGLVADGTNATAFIIRGTLEVDESGQGLTGTHSFTLVAADGTILMSAGGGGASGTRFNAEPPEAGGQTLPGFPTWTPAPPEAATPTA